MADWRRLPGLLPAWTVIVRPDNCRQIHYRKTVLQQTVNFTRLPSPCEEWSSPGFFFAGTEGSIIKWTGPYVGSWGADKILLVKIGRTCRGLTVCDCWHGLTHNLYCWPLRLDDNMANIYSNFYFVFFEHPVIGMHHRKCLSVWDSWPQPPRPP